MSPLAKLTFLVLDDNPNMTRILRVVLKGFGAETIVDAVSVADALEVTHRQPVDMAFVDYNLGGLDGLAFVRLIRTAADSANAFMPLLMLSAYSEQHRVVSARDAGANDFLVKPVTPLEIYRKILDQVEHPRPFVRAAGFFGPDRRRRRDPLYDGPERRAEAAALAQAGRSGPGESERRKAVTARGDAA